MPSGGARARSGPAPDPLALRRDRKDDAGWVTLPVEGFAGDVPAWPISDASGAELGYWDELWQKPQAVMWDKLGMVRQVAAYARSFVEASEREASAGLKTAVLRMEGELGISVPGMHSLRWKFSEDELEGRRDETRAAPDGARTRLRAIGGGS
jgi:hypothetical protein